MRSIAVFVRLLLLACLGAATVRLVPNEPLRAQSGRPTNTILFTQLAYGFYNSALYIANADGSNEQPLLESTGLDYNPAWSADGQWIAFNSLRNNNQADIFIMRADGSDVRQVTDNPEPDWQPQWEP